VNKAFGGARPVSLDTLPHLGKEFSLWQQREGWAIAFSRSLPVRARGGRNGKGVGQLTKSFGTDAYPQDRVPRVGMEKVIKSFFECKLDRYASKVGGEKRTSKR